MNILGLYNPKCSMVGPWISGGHTCTVVDIAHRVSGSNKPPLLHQVGMKAEKYYPADDFDLIMAFPPLACDDLRALAFSLELIAHACEVCEECGVPYMIESSAGILVSYYRQPDAIIDFDIKKASCDMFSDLDAECENVGSSYLWVGGGFNLPEHTCLRPADEFIKYCEASLRTHVPSGFAQAVYKENKK